MRGSPLAKECTLAASLSCLHPTCQNRGSARCLHCRKDGCATHVQRYLIGGVAYMDLCSLCAREWRRRYGAELLRTQERLAHALV